MRHNKKRNTAFIYETLARELTKSIVEKNDQRKNKVMSILKEYFISGHILARELELYDTLLETKNIQEKLAERILQEVKIAYSRLNESSIFDAQSQVIAAINKGLGQEVWNNFIPNFKSLASVNAVFNPKVAVKKKVLFELALIENMSKKCSRDADNDMKPLDSLTYNSFINKFNDKYGDLLQEQKDLLNRYITSFADNGFELRLYLNEELARLKRDLTAATKPETEHLITAKVSEVVEYLEGFRKREFTETDLNKVLKTQELVNELIEEGFMSDFGKKAGKVGAGLALGATLMSAAPGVAQAGPRNPFQKRAEPVAQQQQQQQASLDNYPIQVDNDTKARVDVNADGTTTVDMVTPMGRGQLGRSKASFDFNAFLKDKGFGPEDMMGSPSEQVEVIDGIPYIIMTAQVKAQ